MIKLEIPELKKESVYEVITKNKHGMDICDTIYDWIVYVECEKSWEESEDYYAKFMLLFCLNTTCLEYRPDDSSICDVSGFISENMRAFERFCNEENVVEYTPEYYIKSGRHPNIKDNLSFYDVYMRTMENLLIGNYSESDYKKLYQYLTHEE